MTYVFFDCECANCLDGNGKICSLGYVKTDSNLEILQKKDIIIDPDAPFLLGNDNGGGIHLAYPLFRFRWAHTFPTYYEQIKRIFTKDPETIAFGFAVKQDISYLIYTCKRYNLKMIEFPFFDIQLLEQHLHQRPNPFGLDHLIEQYGLDKLTFHRSDDDAFMSMEVLKGIMQETNLTIPELIKAYPEAMSNVPKFEKELIHRQKIKEEKRKLREQLDQFYEDLEKIGYNLSDYDSFFYNKTFYYDFALLKEDLPKRFKEASRIKKCGGTLTRNPRQADYVILRHDAQPSNTLPVSNTVQFLDCKELAEKLAKKKK